MTSNPTSDSTSRKVPKNALQFSIGEMKFADLVTTERGPEAPIKMFARSGQPITHWYWGRIVHDMAGMKLRKETCPIDYCHWRTDPIGFLDTFKASNEGLEVSGKLISFDPKDEAAKVIYLGSKGVPYEASIDWSDPEAVIEEIPNGVTVQVNGYAFMGPGYVVRQWSLLGVAVCPFGQDPNTISEFSKNQDPEELEVSIFQFSETPMSATPTPTAPAPTAPAAATPAPVPAAAATFSGETKPAMELASDVRNQFKRFITKFGAEQGAKYFDENLSFESALEKFSDLQGAEIKTLREENTELKTRLSAAKPPGEPTPVSATDPNRPATNSNKLNSAGSNIDRFAAGIVLPGQKTA